MQQRSNSHNKNIIEPTNQLSSLKGDNLVERVMESIKVLGKREEEIKTQSKVIKEPKIENKKVQ